MALFELTGKTVVVAGAGSGIGRATALMVASQGATVVVADIADSAHETVTQITDAGGSARAAVGDISDPAVAEALIADADELAALVVFLRAVEASNVNGALIANDGGWSAG